MLYLKKLVRNSLKNETNIVEFARPNEVVEKENLPNENVLPVFDTLNSTESTLNNFKLINDQKNDAKESSKINVNDKLEEISSKKNKEEESNKIIQPFDSEMFEPSDPYFNNKTDDLENQIHLSPIKKNIAINASSLLNHLMKSPINVLEEQATSNQIIKMSPVKLGSFQSPLSRIMVNNYEESSSFNCIDDVVLAAFINDFSYELVENQSFNQKK